MDATLNLSLCFSPSAWTPAWEHRITGTPAACVARIDAELALRSTPEAVHLSWPIGAGVGGLWIEGGESLLDALERATAELFDPDLCFDDPAEEDMARAMVPLLLAAARAGKEVVS